MKSRYARGTFYVRTGQVDSGNDFVTHDQLLEMEAAGWSISNHTRNHPYLTELSQSAATTEILAGRSDLAGWGLSMAIDHLAYPGGAWNDTVIAAAKAAGCLTGRGGGGVNVPLALDNYFDQSHVWSYRVSVNTGISLATLIGYVDNAINAKSTVTFLIYGIPDSITQANFRALVDYVISKRVPFITIADVYSLLSSPLRVRLG